jgi:hypothetical protein
MNQRQSMRRRLQVLERLPQFQPPPSALEQISSLAMKQMSNEDLDVMINLASDRERGVSRVVLPSEFEALARQDAALETEALRMGFKSFADAERGVGQRR